MSDTYQAIYDAVRSRISNGDIGAAVQEGMRSSGWDISHAVAMAGEMLRITIANYATPSAVYRPRLSIDGNAWCAMYGDNLQDGVAGFGASPGEAMMDFDANWTQRLVAAAARSAT